MTGDDLTISLFFLTTASGFGFEAVRAETAPRRAVFAIFGVACLFTGIFWLQIKPLWPPLTAATISVATNPVSWFVVFMFILAVFAFHKPAPKEKPLEKAPQKPVEKPLISPVMPITPPAEVPKEYVDTTPEYLFSIRRQENMARIQTDRLLAPYLGKWLRVRGVITEIYESSVWLRIGDKPELGQPTNNIMLRIEDAWKGRFHLLELNKTISAIGEIREVNQSEILLYYGELVD